MQRVRELGADRGLKNDAAIEAAAGVSAKTVRGLGSGVQGPTLSTLLALGAALGVDSLDQLLGFSQSAYFARLDSIEGALGSMTEVLHRQVRARLT